MIIGIDAIFVVNKNNKLLGSISDGDIRRGILRGLDIKHKISIKSKYLGGVTTFTFGIIDGLVKLENDNQYQIYA